MVIDAVFPHSSGPSGHVAVGVGIPIPHLCSANWLREDLAVELSATHMQVCMQVTCSRSGWITWCEGFLTTCRGKEGLGGRLSSLTNCSHALQAGRAV